MPVWHHIFIFHLKLQAQRCDAQDKAVPPVRMQDSRLTTDVFFSRRVRFLLISNSRLQVVGLLMSEKSQFKFWFWSDLSAGWNRSETVRVYVIKVNEMKRIKWSGIQIKITKVDVTFLILWLTGNKESLSRKTTLNFYLHQLRTGKRTSKVIIKSDVLF